MNSTINGNTHGAAPYPALHCDVQEESSGLITSHIRPYAVSRILSNHDHPRLLSWYYPYIVV